MLLKKAWRRLRNFWRTNTPVKTPQFRPPKDEVVRRLLQSSYFPNQRPSRDELPPVFRTSQISVKVARKLEAKIPKGKYGFDAIEYKLTRADGQIRASHIPHPAAYSALVLAIDRYWEKLPDIFNNQASFIKPRLHRDGRLIVMKYESWLTKTLRSLQWKMTARYVVHADITNFFSSIYTHSLGWAVAGIQEAKSSNGSRWYDKLDKAFRFTKRNETNGVLVGPATSNIAAELVLFSIDKKLSESGYRFYRHIDDYKCYCDTQEKAEQFIADLTRYLSDFKLTLNAGKTKIQALPLPDAEPWVDELRVAARALKGRPSAAMVQSYLDLAARLAAKFNEPNAYKYAVTVLVKKRLNSKAKLACFTKVIGYAQFVPNLIPLLHHFLPSQQECIENQIGETIVSRLNESARFARSDEMSWLIYLSYKVKQEIPIELAEKILNRRDCIATVMLFATCIKMLELE